MKKTKIIIPALGMLLLSTAASVTGTVAWFSMNSDVTASSMSVTAVAESGIAIAPYKTNNTVAPLDAEFKNIAPACVAAKTQMRPTFTDNGVNWYHAKSVDVNNGQSLSTEGYEDVSSATDIYLLNKFQIKSTADTTDVYVKGITLQASGGQEFDACARVLIKSGDATLFFAPISPATHTSETTGTGGAISTAKTINFTTVNTQAALVLDDLTTTAEDVDVYLYFDGEDVACKSINIYSFVATTVDVVFTSIAPQA